MTRPRKILLFTALLLVPACGGAAFVWRWAFYRPAPVLDPGWSARAFVLAGDGAIGSRNGPAFEARFVDPFGVAAGPGGIIYIGDASRVLALGPDGFVRDVAGGFTWISALAVGPDGAIFAADTGSDAVRRIARDGSVSTVAADAGLNGPVGIAVDAAGRVFVADTYNDRIQRIDIDGSVTTVETPPLDTPCGIAVDGDGRLYVADTGGGVVHVIDPSGSAWTLEPPWDVQLSRPLGIAVSPDGGVYVTDEGGRILEFTPDGRGRLLAGGASGFADGEGRSARFRRPSGVALLGPGRLVVADTGNALIRLVTASQLEIRPPSPPLIRPRFDAQGFGMAPLLWPVPPMAGPHEIAGTMGEARGNEAERLHAGVDVRIGNGTPVLAVRPGLVSSPISTGGFASLNESLQIGDVTYIHMRAGRGFEDVPLDDGRFVATYDASGTVVRMRVKRGARFETGEVIGSVNRFNHVHLNVGWPGEEHNPLGFRLVRFTDTIPPTIASGGITLLDASGERLSARSRGRLVVSGAVQIIVDAFDRTDGNRPGRRLAPYALGYQVLHADGTPAAGFEQPMEMVRFNQLGREADAGLIYAPGSGIPFYGRRTTRFLFTVTNTFRDGVASAGRWDTGQLPPGPYTLRVFAADTGGNSSSRDLPVTIEPAADR